MALECGYVEVCVPYNNGVDMSIVTYDMIRSMKMRPGYPMLPWLGTTCAYCISVLFISEKHKTTKSAGNSEALRSISLIFDIDHHKFTTKECTA